MILEQGETKPHVKRKRLKILLILLRTYAQTQHMVGAQGLAPLQIAVQR